MTTMNNSCAAAYWQLDVIADQGGEIVFAIADGRTYYMVPGRDGDFAGASTQQLLSFMGLHTELPLECELDITHIFSGRNAITLFDCVVRGRSVKGMHALVEAGDVERNRALLESAVACLRQLDAQERLLTVA
jgi:hypothetical protein